MTISICQASKADKNAIKRFYRQQNYSASFMGLDTTYLAKDDEEIIGAVIVSRLKKENQQVLLHALVVRQSYQRKGIAKLLLAQCTKQISNIRCFANPNLAEFYRKVNFLPVCADELSEELLVRYINYSKHQTLMIFG